MAPAPPATRRRRPPRVIVVGLGPAGPETGPAARTLLRAPTGPFAHGAATRRPPGAAPYRSRPSTTSTTRPRPSSEVYAAHRRGPGRARPPRLAEPAAGRLRRARLAPRGRAHRRAAAGRPPGGGRRSYPAPSFLDLAWARLGVDPVAAGVRLVDGDPLRRARRPASAARCWWPSAGPPGVLSRHQAVGRRRLGPGPPAGHAAPPPRAARRAGRRAWPGRRWTAPSRPTT